MKRLFVFPGVFLCIAWTWAACGGSGSRCGDGELQAETEACDDGEHNGAYGFCSLDCSGPGPRCGDGELQAEQEACDDGEHNGAYGFCGLDCSGPGPRCGDGVLQSDEELCDDGQNNGAYGFCAADCQGPGPHCGDGWVQDERELCDSGLDNGGYGFCAADCQGPGPRCGDGVVQSDEELCDDGQDNGAYGFCAADCSGPGPRCGDGELQAAHEVCDSGEDKGKLGACDRTCSGPQLPWLDEGLQAEDGWLSQPPACTAEDWLAKYLHYRLRLRKDFLNPGLGPGMSLPASYRNPLSSCVHDWFMQDGECLHGHTEDDLGLLGWGDTTISLGSYLAVLATEYAVFEHLGLDSGQTVADLHDALQAFNRLDERAEFHYGLPGARDGFFQRGDVPWDFVSLSDGSPRFPHPDPEVEGFGCVKSEEACVARMSIDDGFFASQDQVIGMLFGLGLVWRLLPEELAHSGVLLREEAQRISHNMIVHLRSNLWRVTDPEGDHPPDAWGGNAIAFSDQLARAANRICEGAFGISDYRDSLSDSLGTNAFAAFDASWPIQIHYNQTMALILVGLSQEWDVEKVTDRVVALNKDNFALSYALINGMQPGGALSAWTLESMLSSAPCSGPCHRTPGCEEAYGWMGGDRFRSQDSLFGNKHHNINEFNGMDYMLLHNLVFLLREGEHMARTPEAVAADCADFLSLDQVLEGQGDSYDPFSACAHSDLQRHFCGRSFAAWLRDAYTGRAKLFAGGRRFHCQGRVPCLLLSDAEGHSDGVDLILGSAGADELYGGDGDDCLMGFAGDDLLRGGQGRDELHGGDGNDVLYGEDSGVVLSGAADLLFGEAGDDELHGGPGNDQLVGGEGADALYGDGGDDHLAGDAGDDRLWGGDGSDMILAGEGDDEAHGEAGDDVIYGDAGRDKLEGGPGDDWLRGGTEGDMLKGDAGADRLFAEGGLDRLCGGADDDELWGDWDGDECWGGGQNDAVHGCSVTVDDSFCDEAAFAAW